MLNTGKKGLMNSYETSFKLVSKLNQIDSSPCVARFYLNGSNENFETDGIATLFSWCEELHDIIPLRKCHLQLTQYYNTTIEDSFYKDRYTFNQVLLFEEEIRPCFKYGFQNVLFAIYDKAINSVIFATGDLVDLEDPFYINVRGKARKCYKIKGGMIWNIKDSKRRVLYDYYKIKDLEEVLV